MHGDAASQCGDGPREYQHNFPRQYDAVPMSNVHRRDASADGTVPLIKSADGTGSLSVEKRIWEHAGPSETEFYDCQKQDFQGIDDRKEPDYKPSALRWPFLSLLLLALVALLSLLAYGLHVLPVKDIGIIAMVEGQDDLIRRQTGPFPGSAIPAVVTSPSRTSTAHHNSARTTQNLTTTMQITTTGAYGDVDKSITPTSAASPASDAFGDVDITVTEPITTSTTTSAFENVDTTVKGAFGNVDKTITEPIASSTAADAFGNADETISITSLLTNTDAHGNFGQTMTVSDGTPTLSYIPAAVTTLTNSAGLPTLTSTSTPTAITIPTITTLTNSAGVATATMVTSVLATPIVSTLTDSAGVATTTVTKYPVMPSSTSVAPRVYYISSAEYFVGFCLPTLLTTLVAIPIRILDLNAKLFQPWHELTHTSGATGRESLYLPTGGLEADFNGLRSLFGGQALVFLTTVLLLCSSLLTPLSAEAVVLHLRGNCPPGSAKGCTYELGIFSQPAKATIVLLGIMCFTVILLIIFLMRWRTGVKTNPWNISGIAGLTQNGHVRALFTHHLQSSVSSGKCTEKSLKLIIADRRFKLGWFQNDSGQMEYGVMLYDQDLEGSPLHTDDAGLPEAEGFENSTRSRNNLPFMLGYVGRLIFLFLLSGLLGLILYYNNTGDDTGFERFMDSQSFGTKFLFTSVGVVITLFWSSFVGSIAIISPYQLLAKQPQLAERSILLSLPTNSFSSVTSGFRRRHLLLAVVGLTAILSEFLTIFLSNIPYSVTQTWLASRVCAWGSISILATMVLVVAGSFLVRWPHMPVDPSTIAGAMYYVCDSWMLNNLEHISMLNRNERDWRVKTMDLKYRLGKHIGQTGAVRVGVDRVDGEVLI
ncbi:hypothetical protein JX266_004841 [Neoarthrinium moseri]|nr:hypothetical protein JX266_004841 [Neoarthrinium moseri]